MIKPLTDKRLCLDCRYYQSRQDWTRICCHPKNLDRVDESPIYSAAACRNNAFMCGLQGYWWEKKVDFPPNEFECPGFPNIVLNGGRKWWERLFGL